jgi:hypothetical protein
VVMGDMCLRVALSSTQCVIILFEHVCGVFDGMKCSKHGVLQLRRASFWIAGDDDLFLKELFALGNELVGRAHTTISHPLLHHLLQ